MGQVILEIPQNVNRTIRIDSEERAAEILEQLENDREAKIKRAIASGAIELPKRKSLREDSEAVLGIWADRPESGQEIARQIREKNRKVT
jgi:chlorite dismutase